jgi:hypothetical protein
MGTMRIPLSNGGSALIDDEDLPLVSGYRWGRQENRSGKSTAFRHVPKSEGLGVRRLYLHRVIDGTPDDVELGFRNGDGLDCRRANLVRNPRFGEGNVNWKGDAALRQSKRYRVVRAMPDLGPCEECGRPAVDRHHKDGNTGNNDFSNIARLCRSCHMRVDGRTEALIRNAQVANAARPPEPCRVCGKPSKPLSKGRCHRCKVYFLRTGRERPDLPDARIPANREPAKAWHCGGDTRGGRQARMWAAEEGSGDVSGVVRPGPQESGAPEACGGIGPVRGEIRFRHKCGPDEPNGCGGVGEAIAAASRRTTGASRGAQLHRALDVLCGRIDLDDSA